MRLTLNIPGQRQPLGEILVREGLIDPEVLDDVLIEQRSSGSRQRLGTILLEKGLITPHDFMRALSKQLTTVRYYSRHLSFGG